MINLLLDNRILRYPIFDGWFILHLDDTILSVTVLANLRMRHLFSDKLCVVIVHTDIKLDDLFFIDVWHVSNSVHVNETLLLASFPWSGIRPPSIQHFGARNSILDCFVVGSGWWCMIGRRRRTFIGKIKSLKSSYIVEIFPHSHYNTDQECSTFFEQLYLRVSLTGFSEKKRANMEILAFDWFKTTWRRANIIRISRCQVKCKIVTF